MNENNVCNPQGDESIQPQAPAAVCNHRAARYKYARFLIFKRRIIACKCGYKKVTYYVEFTKGGK